MNSLENATLVDHFSRIPDFRCKHNKRHKLVDIMVITICAVIGGGYQRKAGQPVNSTS